MPNRARGRLTGLIPILLIATPAAAQVGVLPGPTLAAPDADFGDEYGQGVAVSGDLALVGAHFDDDVDPTNLFADSGSAYVFERAGTSWAFQAKLTASDAMPVDFFGNSVDVDGATAVVCAPNHQDPGRLPGTVYVFERVGGVWTETAKLSVADPVAGDGLRGPVRLDGDTLAVGAPSFGSEGAVFVFRRESGAWSEQARLQVPVANARLGFAVDLDGDTLAASAPGDSGAGFDAGAVYVFTRSGTAWTQEARLVGSTTADHSGLGFSVALADDVLAAGSIFEERCTVWERAGGAWTEAAVLAGTGGDFGTSCALADGRLVVGAPFLGSGELRVYERGASGWAESSAHVAAPGQDSFAHGVALDEDTVLAGAIAANQGRGEAYVLTLAGGAVRYCTAKPNSLGCLPRMASVGAPSASSPASFLVQAHDVLPGEVGLLTYGYGRGNTAFHGGVLCVKAPLAGRFPAKVAQPGGTGACPGVLTRNFQYRIQSGADPQLTVGRTVYAQWRQRDPGDPTGFGDSLSDGLRFTVAP